MRLATDSSVFAVNPGGAGLHENLEFCDPLVADDPLLPGDRGGVLFHVVTTLLGRKSCWLLEVADIDDCSLMVKYGDGKNHYIYIYITKHTRPPAEHTSP